MVALPLLAVLVQTLNGATVDALSAPPGTRAIVYLFTSTECPVSNRYAPEIRRIDQAFSTRGVLVRLVYPARHENEAAIREHMAAYSFGGLQAVRDPHLALVKFVGATITPEAAVLVAGKVVYRGRIDDRYVDLGVERPAPTTHDLADALEAVLAGRPVQRRVTQAVGCYIADLASYEQIAALLSDRCAVCHHPEGSAPFSLFTYDDAKRHARQIAIVTKSRFMPPWKVEPTDGPFIGQHPLSEGEIDLIQHWVDQGAPGTGGQIATRASEAGVAAGARAGAAGWQLGTPDLVVTLSEPYVLTADGSDVFRIFVLPIPVDAERYVRGLEFRPGNPKVVHHANIRVDRTPASRTLDEADPAPGYTGLIARSAGYPDGHFLGWTPGQVAPLVPDDLAWRLEPHTDLVVEVHMQPSGKKELVQPSVAFYFGDRPPTRTPIMLRLGRQTIDIPAGESRYTITDSYVLPVDIQVLALQPHAHYRLREAHGAATLPDGTVKPLLLIKDWDFRWQHVYRYVTPLELPRGTTLSMRYTYDNSPGNPRNPEHPPKRARWGQRSADEMGDLWIQALTRTEADLVTLDTQFRRKVVAEDVNGYEMEIARRPDDVGLRDTAALLYLELGRADPAVEHFRRSLALKGASAPAHYNVGTAFTLARRLDEAVYEYKQAIAIDPSYANAHNNLGNVYLAQGKVDEAVREFREVVRLQPDSPSAKANLEAALKRR